jgi:hypothetical protein
VIVIEVLARGCEPRWAADTEQDRHVISQTFDVAAFPFRCAGSTPAAISLEPITSTRRSPIDPPRAPAEMATALSQPRVRADIEVPSRWRAVHHRDRRQY